MFKKYINFDEVANNIDNGIYANCDYFLKKSDNCKNYVDDEIEDLSENDYDNIMNIINKAQKYEYEIYNENIKISNKDVKLKKYIYKSKNGIYKVCYITMKNQYSTINIIGLIAIKSKKYVFLGCSRGHPFIATNEFGYGNSDGSGPEIKEKMNNNFDCKTILDKLQEYYVEFINNEYH